MIHEVELTITYKSNSIAIVGPFNHERGLQTITDKLGQQDYICYKVPAYKVQINGGNTYEAIRYGYINDGRIPPPLHRKCDKGIVHGHVCHPTWKPHYSPHSFTGSGRSGAWVLFPHDTMYIHEGPDRRKGGMGGTLGCVEILDGKWNSFLKEIEDSASASCAAIAAARKLRVKIEAGERPVGTFAGAFPSD